VTGGALKLTVHFGESDRIGNHLLSDALLDTFAEHGLHAAVLLRAVEGFGLEQTLRTDRFLSLSEDLPLIAVAVDGPERIERVLPHVTELLDGGLVTLERAILLPAPTEPHEEAKVTLFVGRLDFMGVVDVLHRHGLAGATVLPGVDGMAQGQRRRARFFSRNQDVPALIESVGTGDAVAAALRELGEHAAMIERVRVCKRDGAMLAEPLAVPAEDESGLGIWQKLTVYAGEQARHAGSPLHVELIRRLRRAGASGATSVRGLWGFSGDHPPHGDRLFRVRRDVPVVTTIVDSPEAIRRWFRIVDECTDEHGLVTSELVPAFHAVAQGTRIGGLRLSRP